MKKNITILIAFILGFTFLKAQKNVDEKFKQYEQLKKKGILENSKKWDGVKKFIENDILNNRYYQALIKNGVITKENSEYQLKSSLYGLIRIFDTTKRERKGFEKLAWARNTTIGLGAVIGSGNNVDAFSTSLSINLINGRDNLGSNLFKNTITKERVTTVASILYKPALKVQEVINDKNATTEQKEEAKKKLDDFQKNNDFSLLKGLITDDEIKECEKLWNDLSKDYDNIQSKLNGAPLLVFKHDGNYKNKAWQKLDYSLEFLKGLGNKEDSFRKYDFYAGVFYKQGQDTLNPLVTLNRTTFNAKIGINAVLLHDEDGNSLFEAFGGAEYMNISKGVYVGEDQKAFKLDITLTTRIAKNIFLPFQVKYNPSTGRFEGYVDLKIHIFNVFK